MRRGLEALRACIVVAISLAAGVSHAAVILEIDLSNPANVVFTPTGAFAEGTFLDVDTAFNGITLPSFFSGNAAETDSALESGSIDVLDSPAGTTRSALDWIFVGFFPGGWTPDDLSFYSPFGGFTMSFSSSEPALAGGASHDLSAFSGLPSPGTGGDILAGLLADDRVIGQWIVIEAVPEPATLTLLGVGVAAAAFRRRKRSS